MDLLNVSKMIWSTTTSPTHTLAFRNLFKLLMHNTGNDMEKFPEKHALPNLLETSPNPSLMHPSQTQQVQQKFFVQAKEQLWLYPGQHF